MTDIGHGSVIRYAYLWAREHDRGEEAGRKVRPACIVLITRGKDGREIPLIFPITSRSPRPGTEAVEIPEIEARRARLYTQMLFGGDARWVNFDQCTGPRARRRC